MVQTRRRTPGCAGVFTSAGWVEFGRFERNGWPAGCGGTLPGTSDRIGGGDGSDGAFAFSCALSEIFISVLYFLPHGGVVQRLTIESA
jgi:hypothetical protein